MQKNDSRKTLRSLFCDEKYDYIFIPRIQRDYAQGRNNEEARVIRENILDDVASGKVLSWGIIFGVSDNKSLEDGSVKKCFIPIDGQQRLTTLFLLYLYAAKRHNFDIEYIKNFNYETRNASRDFIEVLVENWNGENHASSLKDHIINQGWFLNYWILDPTVDAILNMLNSIDKRFSKNKDVFENLERISFEFLDLKSLELNETLYLKMNSRGRKLSQFDKIKSEIDKIISKCQVNANECDFHLYSDSHLITISQFADKWRYCIDRKWSDIFWDKTIHNFDRAFIAFLVNYLIASAGKDYKYANKLLDIDFKDSSFFLPWKYLNGYLMEEENCNFFLKNIASILNKVLYNFNKSEVVKELIRQPLNYTERAIQYGLLSFNGKDFASKAFNEWERFVLNYAKNTVDDKETFFAFAKRIKEEYSFHSNDILIYLSGKYNRDNYERDQLNEEYFKAFVILNGGELERTIRNSERHPLLNGRIRPLLVEDNHYNIDNFIIIWNRFIEWFGEDGKALKYVENDSESLTRRVTFATAFTKSLTRWNQLFEGIRCLDFSGGVLKEKLSRERFEPIFRRCLLSNDLTNLDELPWFNANETEGIQTKASLLQNGVIEGILSKREGEYLRFSWYHNCSCFFPHNGRINESRIGFDRISNDSWWTRNRNNVLKELMDGNFLVLEDYVSADHSVALWWGSDIRFINQHFPNILLMWDAYYNIGIVNQNKTWVKRKFKKEGQGENYLFNAVGKNAAQIEKEINLLLSEYNHEIIVDENSAH